MVTPREIKPTTPTTSPTTMKGTVKVSDEQFNEDEEEQSSLNDVIVTSSASKTLTSNKISLLNKPQPLHNPYRLTETYNNLFSKHWVILLVF